MKEQERTQVRILQGKSAEDLQEQMNRILYKHNDAETEISLGDLRAYVKYTETVQVFENVKEEMEASGIIEHCGSCPHFEPTLTANGSVDKRCLQGKCKYAEWGTTRSTSVACLLRYQRISSGIEERSGK